LAKAPNSLAFGRQSALAEAYGLYRMIQPECSVEEHRELIAAPPNIERVLRAYAKAHVEDAHWIEACPKFRKAVAEEFERLLCAGAEGQRSMTGSLISSSKGVPPRSSGPENECTPRT
jgi:hypothetical protein